MKQDIIDIRTIIHSTQMLSDLLNEQMRIGLENYGYEDIPPSYAPAFRLLKQYGGAMPITKFAKRFCKSKPYVTHMVNTLEKLGYFERRKSLTDKRLNYVVMTNKGQEAQVIIDMVVEEAISSQFSDFSVHEKQITTILLEKATEGTSLTEMETEYEYWDDILSCSNEL